MKIIAAWIIKNYETSERTFVEDIFDKACEYIDVSEIGNTEAERFGEKGSGFITATNQENHHRDDKQHQNEDFFCKT